MRKLIKTVIADLDKKTVEKILHNEVVAENNDDNNNNNNDAADQKLIYLFIIKLPVCVNVFFSRVVRSVRILLNCYEIVVFYKNLDNEMRVM